MRRADLPTLDIRPLLHQGLLQDSTPGTLSLGELVLTCVAPDRSALLVRWSVDTGTASGMVERQQALPLRWTGVRGRPGAHRVCWRCPKCERPTPLLYLLNVWVCAKCLSLCSGLGAAERLRRAKDTVVLLEAASQGAEALVAELARRMVTRHVPSSSAVLVTGRMAEVVELDAEVRHKQRLAAMRKAKRERLNK